MINGVPRGTGLPKEKWRRNGDWVAGQRFTATSIDSGGGSERERSVEARTRESERQWQSVEQRLGWVRCDENFDIRKSLDTCMDNIGDVLGKNRLEDVTWLCSLSESELDMLISLKIMLIQRAKVIGHESLAENFDLKMLRALGFILMEYLKGKVKDLSLGPDNSAAFMDHCKLLKCNLEKIGSVEELKTLIGPDSKKRRLAKRHGKGVSSKLERSREDHDGS